MAPDGAVRALIFFKACNRPKTRVRPGIGADPLGTGSTSRALRDFRTPPAHGRADCQASSLNAVTLSALVQTPTLPVPMM